MNISSDIFSFQVTNPLGEQIQLEIDEMNIKLPFKLASAHANRKSQFLTGRFCAYKALVSMGYAHSEAEFDLPVGNDGGPIWPEGYIGSITHSDKVIKAIASKSSIYQGLGLDCQTLMNDKTYQNIKTKILTTNELKLKVPNLNDLEMATLIFSTKEAIYKCLRPLCGKFFGFYDAEITSIDQDKRMLSYVLLNNIGNGFNKGLTGEAAYEFSPEGVEVITWLQNSNIYHVNR